MSKRLPPGLALNLPLLLAALAITGWVFWQAQLLLRSDYPSQSARQKIGQWASGAVREPSEAAWASALQDMQAALSIAPGNPVLQEQLGDLYTVAGRRDWYDTPVRKQHFANAVAQYKKALALRPTDPQTWASLAAAYQGLGEHPDDLAQAWHMALKYGPHEGHVQPMLLELALSQWATATPDMQQWAKAMFDNAAQPQRKAINNLAARYGLMFQPDPPTAIDPAP